MRFHQSQVVIPAMGEFKGKVSNGAELFQFLCAFFGFQAIDRACQLMCQPFKKFDVGLFKVTNLLMAQAERSIESSL